MCIGPLGSSNQCYYSPAESYHHCDLVPQLDHAIGVHRDHVSAVLAVDYSPTGQQFVSGSYDKTLRIWDVGENKSSTVYHTKRMCEPFATAPSVSSRCATPPQPTLDPD